MEFQVAVFKTISPWGKATLALLEKYLIFEQQE